MRRGFAGKTGDTWWDGPLNMRSLTRRVAQPQSCVVPVDLHARDAREERIGHEREVGTATQVIQERSQPPGPAPGVVARQPR